MAVSICLLLSRLRPEPYWSLRISRYSRRNACELGSHGSGAVFDLRHERLKARILGRSHGGAAAVVDLERADVRDQRAGLGPFRVHHVERIARQHGVADARPDADGLRVLVEFAERVVDLPQRGRVLDHGRDHARGRVLPRTCGPLDGAEAGAGAGTAAGWAPGGSGTAAGVGREREPARPA